MVWTSTLELHPLKLQGEGTQKSDELQLIDTQLFALSIPHNL